MPSNFTRHIGDFMTVADLISALVGVPQDTVVLIEFQDTDEIVTADTGSVTFNADEKTFTIVEAS